MLKLNDILRSGNLAAEKRFSLFILFASVIVIAYWPTAKGIASEWQSVSHYSHGWFSLLFFLYYLWQTRQSDSNKSHGYILCLVFIILTSLVWWIGTIASIALLQQVSIYGLLLAAVWLCWGWSKLLEIKYALLVLALAVPVWQFLQFPLRDISTVVTYQFVKLVNIPVFIDGYYIQLPGGSFFVEPACSGLSFFLVAMTLSFMFSALQKLNVKSMLVIFSISVVVAILSNWIRIIIIVVVGHFTNMDSIIVHDHLTFGWIVFAVIYCPVFWFLVRRYSRHSMNDDKFAEQTDLHLPSKYQSVCGVVLLTLFPVVHAGISSGYNQPMSDLFKNNDASDLHFVSVEDYSGWRPHFEGASTESMKMITVDGVKIPVYAVGYSFQTQTSELINVNNNFYDRKRWRFSETISGDNINLLKVSNDSSSRLVAYTYIIAGKQVVNWRESKWLQIVGYFSGQPESYGIAVFLDSRALSKLRQPEKVAENLLNDVVQRLGLVDYNAK